jgi:adenylate cyclase
MDAAGRPPRTAFGGPFGAVVLALLLVLAGALALGLPFIAAAETQVGLRFLFAARGPVAPPADVVVVAIDERSASALGLPESPRLWPRSLHADLVRRLDRAGARVIAFDLTFDKPSAEPSHDAAFAAAMVDSGRVVLATSVSSENMKLGAASGPRSEVTIQRKIVPTPVLEAATAGTASFLLPKDARVDFCWMFRDDAGGESTLPTLALQVYARDAVRRLGERLPPGDAELASLLQGLAPARAGGDSADRLTLRGRLLDRPEAGAALAQLLQRVDGALEPGEARAVRALVEAHAAPGLGYLDYYGPPRTVATVSYVDALGAEISSAGDPRFRGKAVFVGFAPETPGAQDRLRDDYRTVYGRDDGLDLSGVEIAATAFANLIDGRVLRVPAWPWQLAIVSVFGLLLTLLCRLLRPLAAAFAVVALALVYLALAEDRFAQAALWLPVVVPVGVQAPLALFAGVWLRYREARRQREAVRRAFAHFVPAPVVDELVDEPETIEQRHSVVYGVCLSTDVERYTTLAEQLPPDALGKLMNEYYAEVFVSVEKRRGIIVDLVGDATMAVWVGTSSPVQARRSALRSALEMAEAVERFNAAHGPGNALPTRFGVHAGDLMFGVVGASGHHEYRAVGDIANTASRIQGLNKVLKTRVLASEASATGVDDVVVCRVGTFRLVGKSQAVSVVHPLGVRGVLPRALVELAAGFEVAMSAYAERRWGEAVERFDALLVTHPGDGPSRFYRDVCARLVAEPPGEDWTPVVRVETK